MPTVKVATFNAENLFARFRFNDKKWSKDELEKLAQDGWLLDDTKFEIAGGESRTLTAQVIKETRADIIALQEIECMDTLRRFNAAKEYLGGRYSYRLLIDGNDSRLIDVALLARRDFRLGNIRTHMFERRGSSHVFSRDCLEVDILLDDAGATVLTLYVNHFKSMIGGRSDTAPRRLAQAQRVVEILRDRFGDPPDGNFVVLGDLNDYMDERYPSPAIEQLLAAGLVNVNDRIADPDERWTHHYNKGNEYRQLDYILLSPTLARANPDAVPTIVRSGLSTRATRYTGRRLENTDNTRKASDHCPVVVELTVPEWSAGPGH